MTVMVGKNDNNRMKISIARSKQMKSQKRRVWSKWQRRHIISRIQRAVRTSIMFAALVAAGACASIEAYTPTTTDVDGNAFSGSLYSIETVRLGGAEQTITIRAADDTNPVLLYLHGGPGLPSSPWASWNNHFADLEANFALVH